MSSLWFKCFKGISELYQCNTFVFVAEDKYCVPGFQPEYLPAFLRQSYLPLVVHFGQSENMLFFLRGVGVAVEVAHQHINGGSVHIGKRNAVFDIGNSFTAFPFCHCLPGYIQLFGDLLLREAVLLPEYFQVIEFNAHLFTS